MEPTQEQAPSSSELPRPSVDSLPAADIASESLQVNPESGLQPPAPSAGTMTPGSDAQGTVASDGQSPPNTQPITAADDAALIADDADLIEKEWVARAKSVVEQTKTDPFVQNNELNKVKADYIKKRYNKDIKVSE